MRPYDFGMATKKKRGSKIGFVKLKAQLAAKGVRNPGGLAATIGRKKYGKVAMAKKAATGIRKATRRRSR